MTNYFYTFLLLLHCHICFSQSVVINNSVVEKEKIENVLLQNRNFGKDTVALKKFLSPLLQSNDENLHIVYYNLLADGFANAHENFNNKSDYYYKLSLEKAKSKKNKGLEVWALTNYAFYLYDYKKTSDALKVYMDADNIINAINPATIIFPSDCFKKIGYFMGTIGDTKDAIDYLKKAETYARPNSQEIAAIKDNTGLYYIELNDFANAEKYLLEAKKIALSVKDDIRYAKILGNLALLAQKQGNYTQAERLIKEDLLISEKYKSDRNTMYALILLSKIYINQNKIAEAKTTLQKAAQYALSKSYYKKAEYEITQLNLYIAVKENNISQELKSRRRLSELENALDTSDSDQNLQKSNMLAQKDRYASKLSIANILFEKEQLKNKAIVTIAVLLAILIVFLFIFNQKQKKNRKTIYEKIVLQLQLEKLRSEQKLNDAHNTLASYLVYLTEKNNQIEQLNKEIVRIKKSPSLSFEKEEQQLQKLLDSHLMTDENWVKFKMAFQNEYPDFYKTIIVAFPDLTESNLRMITLMKLNLSNQEISALLGITIDAVKKSKQRLRKKFGETFEKAYHFTTFSVLDKPISV